MTPGGFVGQFCKKKLKSRSIIGGLLAHRSYSNKSSSRLGYQLMNCGNWHAESSFLYKEPSSLHVFPAFNIVVCCLPPLPLPTPLPQSLEFLGQVSTRGGVRVVPWRYRQWWYESRKFAEMKKKKMASPSTRGMRMPEEIWERGLLKTIKNNKPRPFYEFNSPW